MEINGPLPTPLNLTAALSQLQSLRIGQLLQAVVIKQLSDETALLQLLNANRAPTALAGTTPQPLQLMAETPRPLMAGERLQLEVMQLGDKPILKVVTPEPGAAAPLREALLQALPRQGGLAPLLANLGWITQQQSSATPLPPAIQLLAKELIDKLPNREKVSSGEGLKQAIKDSGLFMENKLGEAARNGTSPNIANDLKGLLLKLLSTVQKEQGGTTATATPTTPARPQLPLVTPAPPMPGNRPQPQGEARPTLAALNNIAALLQELGHQSEGGVARTQLHQLASLPTPDQNNLAWSFELPIRHQERSDLFHFIIEEHKGERDQEGKQQQRWSITIAFELEPLGPMYARLQLESGRIGTTFWADSFDTSMLISQNLTELAQRFKEAGLESGELRCYQGQPPENGSQRLPRIVLDVKA